MALYDNLIAYYPLDESSGNRSDLSGNGKTLTDNNTVGNATAKFGAYSAHFIAANSEYLSRNDSAFNFAGDFTIAFWVKLADKSGNYRIVSKWADTSNQHGFSCRYHVASDRFQFYVSKDGSDYPVASADNFGSPTAGVWYFVVLDWDTTNNLFGIEINRGTKNTNSETGTMYATSAHLQVGAQVDPSSEYSNIDMDELRFWSRLLTTAERNLLYTMRASGGNTITTSGDYTIHKFTSDGTFTPDATLDEVKVLVVGGGGAGGGSGTNVAGGGGAGRVVYDSAHAVTPSTGITVTVGDKGTGVYNNQGGSGEDSVFDTITANGGGGGGGGAGTTVNGANGGSGGGAGWNGNIGTAVDGNGNGGTSSGNNGGDNAASSGCGGGGGAGGAGETATGVDGGDGGAGIANLITGSEVYYGGGGGGGGNNTGAGGAGGSSIGGNGGAYPSTVGSAGAVNTGSGGGGYAYNGTAAGYDGGTGVVIVSYLTSASTGAPWELMMMGVSR